MNGNTRRPVFLDLRHIRLPVGALTSVLHRISGVVLALSAPVLIFAWEGSLRGPKSFAAIAALWDHLPVRLWAVLLTWALVHHGLAGVRLLLADLGVGLRLAPARASAWAVNAGGLAVLLLVAALVLT